MQQATIDEFMARCGRHFTVAQQMQLRERLITVDESRAPMLYAIPYKDSTTITLISVFLGTLGVDRFMLGDIGLGVCKLLFGCLTGYIWPLVDIFIVGNTAKNKNFMEVMSRI